MSANAARAGITCWYGPAMAKAGKGSIINIASVSAHLPLSRVVAYSAAKAAVLSLTRTLALEFATRDLRFNWTQDTTI